MDQVSEIKLLLLYYYYILNLKLLHELFELLNSLPQVVYPVMLSRHRKLFELLHAIIAILHTQIIILNSKLPQFPQLGFLYLIDYVDDCRRNIPQLNQEYGILLHWQLVLFRNGQPLMQGFPFLTV